MTNKERQWYAVLAALGLPEYSDAGDVILAINRLTLAARDKSKVARESDDDVG